MRLGSRGEVTLFEVLPAKAGNARIDS